MKPSSQQSERKSQLFFFNPDKGNLQLLLVTYSCFLYSLKTGNISKDNLKFLLMEFKMKDKLPNLVSLVFYDFVCILNVVGNENENKLIMRHI